MDGRFGPYRLGELLGRGGMGEVYHARHTEQDRVVALKLLRPELSDDVVFRRRFLRESRLVAKLTDPHVIPVHNWGEIDGRLYLDMRFVDGEDLAARLRRAGPPEPAVAVAVVTQVANALDAAHRAGLAHRDVKPSNILLTPSADGDDFAYLVDFGIAQSTAPDDTGARTSTGTHLGTLAYMAPERFLGQAGGPAADVYALACVLHECLTGRRPFAVAEPVAYAVAHLHSPPPRPSSRDPRLAGFDEVVATGLAKDPAGRQPTAGALAAAARVALQVDPSLLGDPPRTPPVPPAGSESPGPVRPSPLRHRTAGAPRSRRRATVWAVGLGGAGLVTAVVLVPAFGVARPAAAPASPAPSATAPALSDTDRALLAILPPGFTAATCVADPDRSADATAALRCTPATAGAPGSGRFARFRDVASLDKAMAADAAARRLPFNTGECRAGADVQTTWSKDGRIAGLLSCYAEPSGGRSLRWTDRRAVAMGVVTRADGDSGALYDWWTRYDFGP